MLHLISQLIKMSWFYKNWRWWHQIARSMWNSPKAWKYSVHHHIKVKRRKSYQNKWLTVFLESQFRGLTNYFLINFLSIDKSFWLQSGVNSSALMIKVIRFCSGFKLSGYFLPQAHFLVCTEWWITQPEVRGKILTGHSLHDYTLQLSVSSDYVVTC